VRQPRRPGIENKQRRFRQVDVGLLRPDVTNTRLSPRPGTRLRLYTPADKQTGRRPARPAAAIEEGS
jgi:hypothetical protein